MYAEDADALYCDLAETYGVFDWRALPVSRLAVLACGLQLDSRIKRKLAGVGVSEGTLMLAAVLDRLSTLVWFQTEDGHSGRNRPRSMVDQLLRRDGASGGDSDLAAFDTPEDFEAARAKIIGEGI